MIAMNYRIKLPADYDMEIIKNRVKTNGNKTDGFQDLHMKAYLIAEMKKFENIQNEYAPFYVWNKTDGMNMFLLGGPFNNILNSFGWTEVNTWNVLHNQVKKSENNQCAVILNENIKSQSDFTEFCENEKLVFLDTIKKPTTTVYISAYNPTEWKICHFIMSTDIEHIKEIRKDSLIYELYHLSQ